MIIVNVAYSLIIPSTRLIEGIIRIFVRTGPTYGDSFCKEDQEVEVDIAVPGK